MFRLDFSDIVTKDIESYKKAGDHKSLKKSNKFWRNWQNIHKPELAHPNG